MSLEYSFRFPLPNGLHARPASRMEEVASRFVSEIGLRNIRNGHTANAKSVLSLIGACCNYHDECTLQVSGQDEQKAQEALKTFLANELPHCDDGLSESLSARGAGALPRSLRGENFRFVRGVPAVEGIGWGRAVRIDRFDLASPAAAETVCNSAEEISKIEMGLKALEKKLKRGISRTGGVQAQLLKAHCSIVHDPALKSKMAEWIEERRCSAGTAIVRAAEHFTELLQASDNSLLRERILDIQDICQQLLEETCGEAARPPKTILTTDSICLADSLIPSQFLGLDPHFLRGLALSQEGGTSHSIILARSFGIPVLTGVDLRAASLIPGQNVILDACNGILVTEQTPKVERYYRQETRRRLLRQEHLAQSMERLSTPSSEPEIAIGANVSLPGELENPAFQNAHMIGLFRTEMIFLDRSSAPDEEEQLGIYRSILAKAGNRPVTIRTLDIGGDKPLPYLPLPAETNPFLGFRAVRMYHEFQDLIAAQLRALIRASAYGPMRIMIPMVSCIEEIRWIRGLIENIYAELTEKGISFNRSISIGMMLEVPSAAFMMDHLSKEIDFFSIGANDLSQYFMAADRNNPKVSHLLSPYQPAFLRFLRMIVDAAHANGKQAAMCGEMAGSLQALPLLIGLGLDELSMAIPNLMEIKSAARQLSADSCRRLLEETLQCSSKEEVVAALNQFQHRGQDIPIMERDIIQAGMDCLTREETIKEIVDRLYITGRTLHPEKIEEEVWRREEVYSTGLGHGFAIPHCKSSEMIANSISVMKLREPVDWNSSDGKPVDIVILLAMRESGGDNAHLKIFARLARKIMHDEFRLHLRAENDSNRILDFLEKELEINV